jgi:prepilin-type N-terminal cleavage/methylation domain-containing protein
MKTSRDGFTIIELMVCLAIVALLSAIALPNYFDYLSKAKQAEVALNLTSLHAAQLAHWAHKGSYSNKLAGQGSIQWKPAGQRPDGSTSCYYTYGFFETKSQEGINYFLGQLKTRPQDLGTSAGKGHFTAAAIAELGDGKLDIWTIDENRTIVHVRDGLAS